MHHLHPFRAMNHVFLYLSTGKERISSGDNREVSDRYIDLCRQEAVVDRETRELARNPAPMWEMSQWHKYRLV